ncbi:Cysteine dioxygenase [compost metagenome]
MQEIPIYAKEPETASYGRNVIFRNDHLEVVVIHLPTNSSTAIHDHGADSIGCMYVVEGQITNIEYKADSEGFPQQNDISVIYSGECCIFPYGQIHQLTNPHNNRVISLHVYSPPLSSVRTYTPYIEVLDFVI